MKKRGRKICRPPPKLFMAKTSRVLPDGLLYAAAGINMTPPLP